MPDDFIKIEVVGMDKLLAALAKFPREVKKYLGAAGKEAAEDILNEEGLRKYPPATAANAPPAPYYIRGRGMQYKSGNTGSSERLGTQWTVLSKDYQTTVSNRASYAIWVHGEQQAQVMGLYGWRKLMDVAKAKVTDITRIYQGWVDKLLRDLGL